MTEEEARQMYCMMRFNGKSRKEAEKAYDRAIQQIEKEKSNKKRK